MADNANLDELYLQATSKLLTVSAREYVDSKERSLSDYELSGWLYVHQKGITNEEFFQRDLPNAIPSGIEAVVNVRHSVANDRAVPTIIISGTAMRLKDRNDEK